MKKFINFLVLIASIIWFGVLLLTSINTQLGTDILPQLSTVFAFIRTYGATIILGTFVFFNTIGRGVVRILFGIVVLILLVGVGIMIIKPELLNTFLGLFQAV